MEKDKIFISHSSQDTEIVERFVNEVLKLGLAIPPNRIFCSSIEGQGIRKGGYIPDSLKSEMSHSGLVFLFISKAYQKSEVCLNEVGAAWVLLEKEQVIPILLNDVDFSELGILNLNKVGVKVNDQEALSSIIDDQRNFLNPDLKISLVNKHLKNFCKLLPVKVTFPDEISIPVETNEYELCFNKCLYPFHSVFSATIPEYGNGLHQITSFSLIESIFTKLSEIDFENNLTHLSVDGDSAFSDIEILPSGNIVFDYEEWNIIEVWINVSSSLDREFILFRCDSLPSYKINSDIGGESRTVGILKDQRIVSINEANNRHARFNGKIEKIEYNDVTERTRRDKGIWVFIGTTYHKVIHNYDQVNQFCENLENGIIQVNNENILSLFKQQLKSHPTYVMYR